MPEDEQTTEDGSSNEISENDPMVRLEKARNVAAKKKAEQGSEAKDEEIKKESPGSKALQRLTSQFILKPLLTDIVTTGGIASFGTSWVGLFVYTAIKDLTFGIFGSPLTDPADAILPETTPKTDSKVKKTTKKLRVPARLIIYPMGILVIMIYLTIIVCVISISYAFLNPGETISKLFHEKIGY